MRIIPRIYRKWEYYCFVVLEYKNTYTVNRGINYDQKHDIHLWDAFPPAPSEDFPPALGELCAYPPIEGARSDHKS